MPNKHSKNNPFKGLYNRAWFLPLLAIFALEFFSRSPLLLVFSFIPLGMLSIKKGLGTSILVIGIFVVLHFLLDLASGVASTYTLRAAVLETSLFALWALALVLSVRSWRIRNWRIRTVEVLCIIAIFLSLVSWFVGKALFTIEPISQFITEQGNSLINQLLEVLEAETVKLSLLSNDLSWEKILNSGLYMLSHGGLLIASFLFLSLVTRLSSQLAKPENPLFRLRGLSIFFKPPNYFIWLFSGSLACYLISVVLKFNYLGLLAMNIFLLSAVAFVWAGLGVYHFFKIKFRLPRFLSLALNFIGFLFLLNPRSSGFILGILAVFGVLETWLPFRPAINKGIPPTPEG